MNDTQKLKRLRNLIATDIYYTEMLQKKLKEDPKSGPYYRAFLEGCLYKNEWLKHLIDGMEEGNG